MVTVSLTGWRIRAAGKHLLSLINEIFKGDLGDRRSRCVRAISTSRSSRSWV